MTDHIRSEAQLEEYLSEPTQLAIETLADLDGDLMILGVGGKMGPTLARLAAQRVGRGRLTPPCLRCIQIQPA